MDREERERLAETVARLYGKEDDTGQDRASVRSGQWRVLTELGLHALTVDPGPGRGGLPAAGVVCEARGRAGAFGAYPETLGIAHGLAGVTGAGRDGADSLRRAIATEGWQAVPLRLNPLPAGVNRDRPYCSPEPPRIGSLVDNGAPTTVVVWHDCEAGTLRWSPLSKLSDVSPVATTSRLPELEVRLTEADRAGGETCADPQACAVWTEINLAVDTLRCAEIVGGCWWLHEDALAYAKRRVQFGRPIADYQAVQHQLAMQYSWVEAASLLVRRALMALDAGVGAREAARAAAFVRDRAWQCLFASYNILGGTGFIEETRINHYCRGILGLLGQFGPIQEVEERSGDFVEPGTWLSEAVA